MNRSEPDSAPPPAAPGSWPGGRETAFALLLLAVLTLAATWPAVLHIGSGETDNWDSKLITWILRWDFRQTLRDPLHLFDANIFHPAAGTLAFSENLYGVAILGFPLAAAGLSAVAVYNILLLLGMWLSAAAAWLAARVATGDRAAPYMASLAFAFVPWRMAQLSHFQFHWAGPLALALLALLAYLRGRRPAALGAYAFFFWWNGLCNIHYGLFGGLAVAVLLLGALWLRGRSSAGRPALAIGAATLAVAIGLLPFYLPYQEAAQRYGFRRAADDVASFSARPGDFLHVGSQNKLYFPMTKDFGGGREALFPGLVMTALAVVGLRRVRRIRDGWAFAVLGAMGVFLALGMNTPIYRLLYATLGPLFRSIRDPIRGIVLFHLALGVFACAGLAGLRSRARSAARRRYLTGGAILLAAAEYCAAPLVIFFENPEPTATYRWLADAPLSGAVVELPLGLEDDVEYVFQSVHHFRPIVNGYSGFFPPDYDEIKKRLGENPIPDSVWGLLERARAETVVLHTDRLTGVKELSYMELTERAVKSGALIPLRSFPHRGRRDFVFLAGGSRRKTGPSDPGAEASAATELRRHLDVGKAAARPPWGYIDSPAHEASVAVGSPVFGWALSEAGVREIRVSADDAGPWPAAVGLPHPGVAQSFPGVPGAANAGFWFAVPKLNPGPRELYLTIVANDGAERVLDLWLDVR